MRTVTAFQVPLGSTYTTPRLSNPKVVHFDYGLWDRLPTFWVEYDTNTQEMVSRSLQLHVVLSGWSFEQGWDHAGTIVDRDNMIVLHGMYK